MKRGQKTVIKMKTKEGRRTGATYAAYSPDGSLIVAGGNDGSLQLWSSKGPFAKPSIAFRDAHIENSGKF
jgi:hypothetical protein